MDIDGNVAEDFPLLCIGMYHSRPVFFIKQKSCIYNNEMH